jgi:hypothetical protein
MRKAASQAGAGFVCGQLHSCQVYCFYSDLSTSMKAVLAVHLIPRNLHSSLPSQHEKRWPNTGRVLLGNGDEVPNVWAEQCSLSSSAHSPNYQPAIRQARHQGCAKLQHCVRAATALTQLRGRAARPLHGCMRACVLGTLQRPWNGPGCLIGLIHLAPCAGVATSDRGV